MDSFDYTYDAFYDFTGLTKSQTVFAVELWENVVYVINIRK